MKFRVHLRENGGIAGLERTLDLEGTTLRVLDRGKVRIEKVLPATVIEDVVNRAEALAHAEPKRNYGSAGYMSDPLTTELEIVTDSKDLEVEVVSDPQDPAPPQFWQFVKGLHLLTR
ncbi:MAG: hypothetical protein JO356_12730 [Acidobacteria bacterium]|nr:hypothetical protein [Acidobacteriota bacterium]